MDTHVQKEGTKPSPKKILVISLIVFILIMLAVTGQATYAVLGSEKIYNGVQVNGLTAGSLTRQELGDLLKSNYADKLKTYTLKLNYKNLAEEYKSDDIDAVFDIDGAVAKAYEVGRTGNIPQKLISIIETARTGISIELPVIYDQKKVEALVNAIYDKTLIKVKEADLLIQEDRVTIRSGYHGESIDKNKVLQQIENNIRMLGSDPVAVDAVITPPSAIDVDDYVKKINREPVDAVARIENNSVVIVPHVIGRNIEKSSLVSIASELEKSENTEKILPVVFIQPKTTTEDVNAKLFKDTLYTMNTQFRTDTVNNVNRGENIRIAVSKINGLMLAPGEEFSFNKIVGPRTEAGGYKIAHVYSGGKVIDDVGGGICQVSTTLYNSVLYSNLDVTERNDHQFTVSYVPFGQDAAVSYGGPDFKFRNSTSWPIRIDGRVTKENRIYFTLMGTDENLGRKIEIVHETVKTTDFVKKYIDDPTLEEGKTKVKQNGMKGYVINTYKIIKQDGKITSKTKIYTSTYRPLDEEILKGTKKAPVPAGTAATPQPNPAQ
jgi:vancomycin resistance protein YoaR